MRNLNRLWTAEEEARLRSMLEAGMPRLLVAAKLKRTMAAVKSRSGKLQISSKRTRAKSAKSFSPIVDFPKEPSSLTR